MDPCVRRFVAGASTPGQADLWTARQAVVRNQFFDLENPFGVTHPAMELHHFAVTGVYGTANTLFVELLVERVL